MEDINNRQHNWGTKYANCKYADRLLSRLYELNQQVAIPIDIDLVKKGIYYAKKYHGSQMRQSGDPYYSHPIEVAYMVAEYIVNSGEFESRNDGVTPISNRRATSDDVTNFS